MIVHLVRHTSIRLTEPYSYGQTDVPLAATFPQEAESTRIRLSKHHIDHAYTSPLQRARALADYCGFADATVDPRLREMFMGDYEIVPFTRLPKWYLDQWYGTDFMSITNPGGESMEQVWERLKSFLDELKEQPYREVAVFSHGCAILCLLIKLGLRPPTSNLNDIPPTGSVTTIEIGTRD